MHSSTVWHVVALTKTHQHRFKCMYRFKNILLQNVYSVVLDVAWFPAEVRIFKGAKVLKLVVLKYLLLRVD